MRRGVLLLLIVANVAAMAAMFSVGYMLHRPAHHTTRLEAAFVVCRGLYAGALPKTTYYQGIAYGSPKAAISACALTVAQP